jgi:hypothetical protein
MPCTKLEVATAKLVCTTPFFSRPLHPNLQQILLSKSSLKRLLLRSVPVSAPVPVPARVPVPFPVPAPFSPLNTALLTTYLFIPDRSFHPSVGFSPSLEINRSRQCNAIDSSTPLSQSSLLRVCMRSRSKPRRPRRSKRSTPRPPRHSLLPTHPSPVSPYPSLNVYPRNEGLIIFHALPVTILAVT